MSQDNLPSNSFSLGLKCTECNSPNLPRRRFLQVSAIAAASIAIPRFVHGAPTTSSAAETVVGEFYESLSANQRSTICMPMDHELRSRVNANWHVTKPLIGSDFFDKRQRTMIGEVVRQVTSEDGHARLLKQMDDDDGGLDAYSVAMFGQPSQGGFQWLLTGRHLTLRADGDSVANAAFGGPIVYGHGEESSPQANLFYYQTQQVNEVFKSLDAEQAKQALSDTLPNESAVQKQGPQGKFAGIACDKLSAEQQSLVRDALKTILAPYRAEDSDEAMAAIDAAGGLNALRLAFYRNGDLNDDQIWDNWRIEGPNAVCHFRGSPHVHAYIHIG